MMVKKRLRSINVDLVIRFLAVALILWTSTWHGSASATKQGRISKTAVKISRSKLLTKLTGVETRLKKMEYANFSGGQRKRLHKQTTELGSLLGKLRREIQHPRKLRGGDSITLSRIRVTGDLTQMLGNLATIYQRVVFRWDRSRGVVAYNIVQMKRTLTRLKRTVQYR